jgi:hypothetical protein
MSSLSERPNRDPEANVHLRIEAADQATEIFIVNGTFELVPGGRGQGQLEIDVPPGIYKLRARAGQTVTERLMVIPPGTDSHIEKIEPIAFASPAPLANTAQGMDENTAQGMDRIRRREWTEAAVRESRRVHADFGKGSFLFLFVRGLPGEERQRSQEPFHPMYGLSLHDPQGRLIVSFGQQKIPQEDSTTANLWAACNLSLNPGLYRLSLALPNDTYQHQTIFLTEGWQSQIFFVQRDYSAVNRGALRVDLLSASHFMRRSEGNEPSGFRPESRTARLIELAREALKRQRQPLAPAIIEEILDAKFTNPILGLLGANLLLERYRKYPDDNRIFGSLDQIVTSLRELLGNDIPDVESLAWENETVTTDFTFSIPPLLRASWDRILTATVKRPELVPLQSVAARAGERLWGSGPYLIWCTGNRVAKEAAEESLDFALNRELEARRYAPSTVALAASASLTFNPSERDTLPEGSLGEQILEENERLFETLVPELRLPRSRIEALLRDRTNQR